jgi:hypothetical protein
LKPFCVVSYLDCPQWDSFVERHPAGTLFHSRNMVRAYATTHLYSPLALAAIDSQGDVLALFTATRVGLIGEWSNPFTSRSIHFAEPLFVDTPEGYAAVIELMRIHDEASRRSSLFTEVRPIHEQSLQKKLWTSIGYEIKGYHNYELSLQQSTTDIWKGFTGTCRRNINRAERRGVTLEVVDPFINVPAFYSILKESYANSRIPLVDISHFYSVFREMDVERIRMVFAKLDNEIIAASCFLTDAERVYYWFAGTKRVPGISAMASIVWDALKHYAQTDKKIFDFCGAGWEGEEYGPGRFKAHFGGTLTNLGRYRKVHSQWRYKLADAAYSAVRGILAPKIVRSAAQNDSKSVESTP